MIKLLPVVGWLTVPAVSLRRPDQGQNHLKKFAEGDGRPSPSAVRWSQRRRTTEVMMGIMDAGREEVAVFGDKPLGTLARNERPVWATTEVEDGTYYVTVYAGWGIVHEAKFWGTFAADAATNHAETMIQVIEDFEEEK